MNGNRSDASIAVKEVQYCDNFAIFAIHSDRMMHRLPSLKFVPAEYGMRALPDL